MSPLLFNVYLKPLIEALAKLDCQVYNYAEDTQLIIRTDNSSQAQLKVQNILRFTINWMTLNSLKVNPDKTGVLAIATGANPWSSLFWPLELGTTPIPVPAVKSLGIRLDSMLVIDEHVAAVVGSCVGVMRQLRKLVPLPSFATMRTVVSALIRSRLDYGNAVYIGLPR